MLFAGDDAEALGDGACTIANKAARVNIGSIAKDFMGLSLPLFRLGSLPIWPTPILYRLTPKKVLAKATVPKDEEAREKSKGRSWRGKNAHQMKVYKLLGRDP
jgi:hypothetical protein